MKLIAVEVKIGFNYFAPQNTNKLILPIYQLVHEKAKSTRLCLDLFRRCYCSEDLKYIFDVIDLIPRPPSIPNQIIPL